MLVRRPLPSALAVRVRTGLRLVSLLGVMAGAVACSRRSTPEAEPPVRVAVASNFLRTAQTLAYAYAERTGRKVELASGSTGQLFAQIEQGAPFDVFLAADRQRPEQLEAHGRIVPRSRRTYAVGQLALVCSAAVRRACLRHQSSSWEASGPLAAWLAKQPRLALADPRVAPYGVASAEVLDHLGQEDGERWVLGQDVGQALQFVHTGNVGVGFVARSAVLVGECADRRADEEDCSTFLPVPTALHHPLAQQLVLLREGEAARGFVHFITSDPHALRIIEQHGYGLSADSALLP